MKRLVQIMVVALLALAMPAQAVRRYKCDFESEASRARWTLNPVAKQSVLDKIDNRWYIGEPGNNDQKGHNGLYISDDNGATAHYRNKGCWVFAYDTIALDHLESGDYTIFFDYCVMANIASNFDGVYLMWIPMVDQKGDSINVISIPTSSGAIPSQFEDYIIPLQPNANMDYLCGTVTWQQCVAKIPNEYCDGTKHYLAFAWANGSNQPQQPGGMIDNINITDNTDCNQPTNLTISQDGTTVSLTWQGNALEYEVSAYSYDKQKWSGPKIVTTTATSFSGLPIGQTDFIVRAKCDDDFYSLKTIVSKLIYYPDQLCVDYLNLDNATCYVAATPSSDHPSTDTYSNFIVRREDHGPSSMSSFHTVHFDRTEYEPRTGYQAKTVPDDELASVRLGNWDDQEFAERIEFSFDVDTIKYPVFLLKYMPILEAPTHDDDENPRFMLDMLIGGTSIGRCGMADFNANTVRGPDGNPTAEAAAQGWHLTPKDQVEGNYTNIFWKEWTTVGVNLRKPAYQGKKLTVRLTTFDCVFNAHFGYAYFTLGCSDGKLKGMKCGAINPVFEAPDGFEYRWAYASSEKYRRKANDPTGPEGSLPEKYVLGRGQTYNAGYQDDSLYVVDCMFVQDSTCFFSLYASTLATNPITQMNEPVIYKHCTDSIYQVTFDASPSWVQEIDHVKGDTLVSKAYHIETYEWNIEGMPAGYEAWSDEKIHTFKFPLSGGEYDVTLRTSCGTCDSTIHYHLSLEPLGPTHQTQAYTLCDAARKYEGFKWRERNDTTYHTYGIVDSVNLYSTVTSCDSIIYLKLLEPQRIFVDTMLLPEQLADFEFHGKTYGPDTKSMIDTVPDPNDCSRTWVLNLEIYESLQIEPVTAYILCEGADTLTFVYDINRGRSQSFLYGYTNQGMDTLVDNEQKKGHYEIPLELDPNMEPGLYQGTLKFTDLKPEFSVTVPFTFSLYYSSDVITQRWNDVLAIRNADYNGGYQFDSVQWYVNGQPIEGANTFAYYVEGDGKTLLFGQPYQALLTRNDGTQIFTCEFIPAPVPEAETPLPTLIDPNAPLHIQGRGVAHWYDMLGRRHSTQTYNESDIISPSAKGYYLLLLQTDDAREIHSILVK